MMGNQMFEAETWVAIAFVIFLAVLGYLKVHKMLIKGIDDRRDRIKAELDEARRLKEEAQALLAGYQRKQQEIERAAEGIIAGAKADAERLAAEAEAKLQDFIARHTKMAQERIAQAEAQAVADVRSAAADAAVAAAGTILGRKVKDKVADDLLTEGIAAIAPEGVFLEALESNPWDLYSIETVVAGGDGLQEVVGDKATALT